MARHPTPHPSLVRAVHKHTRGRQTTVLPTLLSKKCHQHRAWSTPVSPVENLLLPRVAPSNHKNVLSLCACSKYSSNNNNLNVSKKEEKTNVRGRSFNDLLQICLTCAEFGDKVFVSVKIFCDNLHLKSPICKTVHKFKLLFSITFE